ncbi:MAG: nucleotidyltransferase domain-containing protein [Deltaproteobacteria bacterium]|nr:nucleotidyltransferase domain-containing protein [Deltaproteobacteria bacterium]
MLNPNLEIGRRFVDENKPPGRMLLCAVTGSHHYGFPSPDSDLDLKGIHLAPTESLLGLESPVETQDRLEIFDGVECDFTSHEARKALKLLLSGNGNMLERILSPFQLYETDALEELIQIARDSLSKRFFKHYRGYFKGMCAEHEGSEIPRAKTLLYTYRVALTGVHLLRTGKLEADLNITSQQYGFGQVIALIEFKREQGEKSALPARMDEVFKGRWLELEALLDEALAASKLPGEPLNSEEISEWLRTKRISEIGSGILCRAIGEIRK